MSRKSKKPRVIYRTRTVFVDRSSLPGVDRSYEGSTVFSDSMSREIDEERERAQSLEDLRKRNSDPFPEKEY